MKQKKTLAFVIIAILLLGFEDCIIAVVRFKDEAILPVNFGNFERNRNALAEQGPKDKFSFAVVGDTQGGDTFEHLCNKLRNEPLSFMVILGDFVQVCTKENHNYFISDCANKYHLPFPVFLVAGNRDVVYDEMELDIDKVSPIDFAKMYGEPNFFFEYNGCLFIGLCILPPPYSTEKSIEFLESTLAKRRDSNRRVFVFMHMPPVTKPDSTTACCENMQELVDIMSKNKVDYVISAHYHGYIRTEYGDTIYLVSGGGGAPLSEKKAFGDLHHSVVLTVDRKSVSEKIILSQHSAGILSAVRHFVMTEWYPFLSKHPALVIVENLIVICVICFTTLLVQKKTYSM